MTDIVDMYQLAALMKKCDNCDATLPAKPKFEREYAFCSATCLLAHRVKRWRENDTLHEVREVP